MKNPKASGPSKKIPGIKHINLSIRLPYRRPHTSAAKKTKTIPEQTSSVCYTANVDKICKKLYNIYSYMIYSYMTKPL